MTSTLPSKPTLSLWAPGGPITERLDLELLARAYDLSAKAHAGQFRKNGDPFVTHCVEVAKVLLEERGCNSPAHRNEKKWLRGWKKRLDAYIDAADDLN